MVSVVSLFFCSSFAFLFSRSLIGASGLTDTQRHDYTTVMLGRGRGYSGWASFFFPLDPGFQTGSMKPWGGRPCCWQIEQDLSCGADSGLDCFLFDFSSILAINLGLVRIESGL